MDRWIRRLVERALLDKVWVTNAANPAQVRALVNLAKPVAVPDGLKRFGPDGDGGYLLPDDLDGISACISPGVSSECGFDTAMAERGIDVLMADASVAGPPVDNPRFHFIPKYLDIWPSDWTMPIEELCAEADDGELILQMDIEGAEYRVLGAMRDALLQRFRIMVIEFHGLDAMFSRFGYAVVHPVFEKLARTHRVVHLHPNNCIAPIERCGLSVPPVMEFTFYRKDRLGHAPAPQRSFPHPLDAPCMPQKRDYALPACWWQ